MFKMQKKNLIPNRALTCSFQVIIIASTNEVGELYKKKAKKYYSPEQPINLPSWTKFAADGRNNSDTERGIWIAGAHDSSAGTKQQHQRVADALPGQFFSPSTSAESKRRSLFSCGTKSSVQGRIMSSQVKLTFEIQQV